MSREIVPEGFSTKSTAPAARLLMVTSAPWAVRLLTITTAVGWVRMISSSTWRPFFRGISTSRVITWGFRVRAWTRASSPSRAFPTTSSRGSRERISEMMRRMNAESSTTSTRSGDSLVGAFLIGVLMSGHSSPAGG